MSFFLKVRKVISEKRLLKTIKKKFFPYLKGFLLFFKPNNKIIKIYISKENKIDKKDLQLKVFKSYTTKIDQEKSFLYKPALWQSHIDNDLVY